MPSHADNAISIVTTATAIETLNSNILVHPVRVAVSWIFRRLFGMLPVTRGRLALAFTLPGIARRVQWVDPGNVVGLLDFVSHGCASEHGHLRPFFLTEQLVQIDNDQQALIAARNTLYVARTLIIADARRLIDL